MVKRNVWVPLYIESWQWKGMFESHYTSVSVLQTSAQAAWVSSPGTRGATMASRGQNTLSLTPLWVSHQVLFLTAVMLQVDHPVHTICLRAITGHVTNTLMFWPSGCQTQSSDNTNVEILMKDASSWLIRYMSVEILIRTGVCGWLVNMLYPCWNIDNVMRGMQPADRKQKWCMYHCMCVVDSWWCICCVHTWILGCPLNHATWMARFSLLNTLSRPLTSQVCWCSVFYLS